jgi:hypothetical protein
MTDQHARREGLAFLWGFFLGAMFVGAFWSMLP